MLQMRSFLPSAESRIPVDWWNFYCLGEVALDEGKVGLGTRITNVVIRVL